VCVCVCIFGADSNTIKIKLELMYTCVRVNDFAPVSTIVPFGDGVIYLAMYCYNHIRNVRRLTIY